MHNFELNGSSYGFLNPYLIAEIGVNHGGDLNRAKALIEQVAKAGGHAAKFQTYKADKLAAKDTAPAYWDTNEEATQSQHELFRKYDAFGEAEYVELANHCKSVGIDFLSTPFDLDAIDFLTPLMPLTKVASADLTNIPLIRKIAATKNPVAMSVGAGNHKEIAIAIDELLANGTPKLAILHCVLNYPTPKDHAQLAQISVLQQQFGDAVVIGYSDHVRPDGNSHMPALETAALMGARVIEKHFTDDKTESGNDHYHAMDQRDLAHFVKKLADLRSLQGAPELNLEVQSTAIANARRRIIAARDLASGQPLAAEDLIALRSNIGIEIARWDHVLGKVLKSNIASGSPITEDLI